MSCVGYPDLGSRTLVGGIGVYRSFGGGPFWVVPSSCDVSARADGTLDWELELVRAFDPSQSRAKLSVNIGTTYALDPVLVALREEDPSATSASCMLTDWLFRLHPAPMLTLAGDLTVPVPLVSAGLGRARLQMPLSHGSALVLERMLIDGGQLPGTAEATIVGVSPRVPAVVRFDPAVLLDRVLQGADTDGALPLGQLIAFFARAGSGGAADLPLTPSGSFDGADAEAFARTMADRVIARFGGYVPAQDPANGPVVRLVTSDPGFVQWALSEPVLVQRRLTQDVDLLDAARAQQRRLGTESLVVRRDLTELPSFGKNTVTVLSTLPSTVTGVAALGVNLTFGSTTWRPQELTVGAVVHGLGNEAVDDAVDVVVRLAPDEPLRYQVTPFALVADKLGTTQLDGLTFDAEGPVLRLAPEDFPVELVLCSAGSDLAAVAVVEGTCTFEQGGAAHVRAFTLDGDGRGVVAAAVAIPLDHDSLRVDVVARARDGSGEVALGPFERVPVPLSLASFGSYGPQRLTVRCDFDDGATSRAISLRPNGGTGGPEEVSTLVLTPAESMRTYRWFATSPFRPGVWWRPYDDTTAERLHVPGDGELVVTSSGIAQPESRRAEVKAVPRGVALPRQRAARVTEAVLAGRESAATGGSATTESGVLPVATSPAEVPTDELVYSRVDDPSSPAYIPRYELDEQVVSGMSRYRIAMASTSSSSTLTVQLVAIMPETVRAQAPGARELPHVLGVVLELLLNGGGGASKLLEFGEVTRNGAQATAVLTFASLAERDDVYYALTDPARHARLLVRRSVDLRIPVPDHTSPPILNLPVLTASFSKLGRLGWPPPGLQLALAPEPVYPAPDRVVFHPMQPVLGSVLDPVVQPVALEPADVSPTMVNPVFSRPIDVDPVLPELVLGRSATRGATRQTATVVSAGLVATMPAQVLGRQQRIENRHLTEARRVDGPGDIGGGVFNEDPFPPRPVRPLSLPTPQLALTGRTEEAGLTRFRLVVSNWEDYADSFFAASPDLPPCGSNTTASRTWVDIIDADAGTRVYGFCALAAARDLTSLWFAVPAGGSVSAHIRVKLTDRRANVERLSNVVETAAASPPSPPSAQPPPDFRDSRVEFAQTVKPDPFVFPPGLHAYIFSGITPGSGGGAQLVRWTLPWEGRTHNYLQDASRPWVVYVFPDEFRIARDPVPPFRPWMTVRVTTDPLGTTTGVVLDYMIAPHVDAARLRDAEQALVGDPRFGQNRLVFQPFTTGNVTLSVDRPTESGSVREQRPDVAVVLRDALKDTVSMSLGDFRLLFDAMHSRTATLFTGHVDIDVGDGASEIIPFNARMELLEGDIFTTTAAVNGDGSVRVELTNQIESPVDVQALDVSLVMPTGAIRGTVRSGLPRADLRPLETLAVDVVAATPVPATQTPDVEIALSGIVVHPDPAAVWDAILDRVTLAYFRLITVKTVAGIFAAVTGLESEQIVFIVVEVEGAQAAELTPAALQVRVRVDYSIDDVILKRPVSSKYRYTTTVIRANGTAQTSGPLEATSALLFVTASA